jgi:tetratricopeptide (TPR) repeat protein
MTSMAKLFCLKIEWLLKKETASPQVLYGLSCEAVCCTVKEEWQEQLSGLWLAPAELEAILLVSWSLGLLGEVEKALFLFHQVWNYPKKKGWEDRMTQLLCPQAALVGMQLYQKLGEFQKAFDIGNSALELLRAQNSQRYAYPLFLSLIDVGEKLKKTNRAPENLQQLKDFRDAFQTVYQENHLPCMRVWQRGSVENCYDVSLVLKRMRLSLEKSQEEICTDENGNEFLQARHLSRIEKGENRPSKENFQLLTKKMGRTLDWIMPILETDSIETLSMRQDMIYLTNMRKWDEVQKILDVLCKKMGTEACQKPRIQQEIQSIRATKLFQTKMIQPKEAQEYCKKALACTFPLEWLSHRELPFLQREEGMIISDIADMYGKMGNIECAENLFQKLYEVYRPQQQFLKVNTPACSVILGGYSQFAGDIARYQKALELDQNNLEHELATYYIVLSGELLYSKAWDYYELDKEEYKDAYRREFICAQRFAEFCNNETLIEFCKQNSKKYLNK